MGVYIETEESIRLIWVKHCGCWDRDFFLGNGISMFLRQIKGIVWNDVGVSGKLDSTDLVDESVEKPIW